MFIQAKHFGGAGSTVLNSSDGATSVNGYEVVCLADGDLISITMSNVTNPSKRPLTGYVKGDVVAIGKITAIQVASGIFEVFLNE